MTTKMPIDGKGNPIPALRIDGAAQSVSVSATTASNATAFDASTKIISLYATVPIFLKFGTDDTVVATSSDHYFPAGLYYDVAIDNGQEFYSHVAAIRAGSDGLLYISEKS